jgi:predicted alpha-1,2-mannosidase
MDQKVKYSIAIGFIFLLLAGCTSDTGNQSNLNSVDPYIGGIGHLLHPTRPNVQLPNQMIRMHPFRVDYLDDQISFFPFTMISHRKGEVFGILPGSGKREAGTWKDRQTYDHDLEKVSPYYFSTYLIDENITTEFTPGSKSGYFRFTFPENGNRILRLHINQEGSWIILSKNSFSGEEQFFGMKAFVYGEFNQECQSSLTEETKKIRKSDKTRQEPVAWLEFSKDQPRIIGFKYGISFISVEQAKENLRKEIPAWDFEALKNQGERIWANTLSQIQVKGGTDGQRRAFYTSLYRTYERMVNINEYGSYYSGYDHQVHKTDRDFYVDDWAWDTYLAQHPLRMILQPEKEADMLNSYTTMYEQGGWMPQFPLAFRDDPAMNGFHSTIIFLDAWRKGIRGFNVDTAYIGMKKNAVEATMLPWRNGPKCELDSFYRDKGYYPALMPGELETVLQVDGFEKRQSVAVTLGHSYDDWALSEMAKELGHQEDQVYYHGQAANYRNLYRPDKKMMWPKNAKGEWIEIDPKFDGGPGGRDYYDENNGYTYQWQTQQDIHGLIRLMGGRERFSENLDQLFREDLGRTKYQYWAKFADATGMVGQFSMGNEPSFHIPYLYNYSGEPWKTQKRIRLLLDVWFHDNLFGIPGDEDGGGMTAFVVFSSMGFYPVTPGLPIYNIGSPVFEEVNIKLENGKTFRMIARNCSVINKYIQSAKLNGEPLTRPWFTHTDLINGAVIELEMGPMPNKEWGSSVGSAPESAIDNK